ncbi:hypothetical protein METBIDRAFT_197389 [Metschnikowia bicuspidata var. bicuspidata NRRL YB-4993]|uniref:Uncharacterized protein n=1 Tax=Metschnikowia bicuspidata var. bicuspidata NRRL YB-4993 TaxID=869754 RepID=A0A1A0H8D4_9ASCO|nr:hypothetical protein METBIDRAFT_197389 [Metschnikowia bicuspidata var. bicuspidata NRRL YB-4993]OBA20374.1 hypothetical protein METBIDRAFT_197389 [Metschnikowia bicuspidata var. bicuspidata NRRL YB-4993]
MGGLKVNCQQSCIASQNRHCALLFIILCVLPFLDVMCLDVFSLVSVFHGSIFDLHRPHLTSSG